MSEVIYLDNNATTKIDPKVLNVMIPYFSEIYSNASSTHPFGLKANSAIKKARQQVADLIEAEPKEIIFTSGATESINLALKGLALSSNTKKHIITTQTEHKAVLDTCKYLETLGFEITYLPVKNDGLLDLNLLEQTIRQDTLCICIMFVNNETGVIQDVSQISQMSNKQGIYFLCDATQAVGKLNIDIQLLGIDIIAFSAHKFHGPKGIGALFINSKKIRIKALTPLIHGGGHEHGLRSGTLNVPAIVGFGEACEIAKKELATQVERISKLRDELETALLNINGSFRNGNNTERLYNVTNMCFPGVDANVLIGQLKNIAISNGSACTAALVEPSHVLRAMGLSDDEAFSSIRFSLSKFTTASDIKYTQESLIKKLRDETRN